MTGCNVYYRDGRILLAVERWSDAGYPLVVFFAESERDPTAVGSAVRRAFEAVRRALGTTWDLEELKQQAAHLWERGGAPEWRQFVRGAALAKVEEDEEQISVTASRNAGSREGFIYEAAPASVHPFSATDAELGRAILEALRKSGAELKE